MVEYLIAMALILLALAGWVFVQQWTRGYSIRHPEFGPHKEEGGGCGKSCACSNGQCSKKENMREPLNRVMNPDPDAGARFGAYVSSKRQPFKQESTS